MKFFDFGDLKLIDGVKSKYEDIIKLFSPNEFGIKTSVLLITKALAYWNRSDIGFLFAALKMKRKNCYKKVEKPFDIFKLFSRINMSSIL